MEYRQFVVPSDEELVEALGVSPETVDGESTVRGFRLTSVNGEDVRISYDALGRSFRVQVSYGNAMRLDLLRESATRLAASADGRGFRVRVNFENADLTGQLDILIGDEVVVQDRLLMT